MREKRIAEGLTLLQTRDGLWLKFEADGEAGLVHASTIKSASAYQVFAKWAHARLQDVVDNAEAPEQPAAMTKQENDGGTQPDSEGVRPPEGWR